MSLRLVVAAMLACLLLTGSDLDGARDEVSAAERRLRGAQSDAAHAHSNRSRVDASLAAATAAFEANGGRAERAGLAVAVLAVELETTEEELRHLSRLTEQEAVTAYMAGVVGFAEAAFAARSLEQALLIGEAVHSARRSQVDAMVTLQRRRGDLRLLRIQHGAALAVYQAEQERLLVLREDLANVLTLADSAVADAYRNLASAEATYQTALTRLEKEERKAAALRGVEHWRSL